MAYFPNGSSGDVYYEQYCFRCVNWREDPEHEGNWGCVVIDLHLEWNYEQIGDDPVAKKMREALEHFIPTTEDGLYADKCRMWVERDATAVPGQMKIEWDA